MSDHAQAIRFFVPGVPVPQGSPKIVRPRSWQKVTLALDSPKLAVWRRVVLVAADNVRRLYGLTPIDGPVSLSLGFVMSDREHKRMGIFAGTRPDLDKLTRAICDSLQAAGLVTEDSRIVVLQCIKLRAVGPVGVHVELEPARVPGWVYPLVSQPRNGAKGGA